MCNKRVTTKLYISIRILNLELLRNLHLNVSDNDLYRFFIFFHNILMICHYCHATGAHTFGQAHCRIIDIQLTPVVSTDLNPAFAANLSRICLQQNTSKNPGALTAHLDFITKDIFDNNYYKNVLNKVAVFHSDAALLNASDTLQLVQLYANDQTKFFQQFQLSMIKLSQLGVLTGNNGIIRKKCSLPS